MEEDNDGGGLPVSRSQINDSPGKAKNDAFLNTSVQTRLFIFLSCSFMLKEQILPRILQRE